MRYTEKTHLIDSDFRSSDSEHSDLLIRITSSRFSYAIIDQSKGQIKVLFEASFGGGPDNLDEVFLKNYLPDFEFNEIKVALETAQLTFIPAALFSEEDRGRYASFLKSDPAKLAVSDIAGLQIKSLSSFSEHVTDLLGKRFSKYKLFNLSNPFIEASIRACDESRISLVLNFNTHSFEALVLSGSNLSFYNAFHCKSIDDFNYFLLTIIRQLDLNIGSTSVLLAGQISPQDEKFKRIDKYFEDISFVATPLIPTSDHFQSVPKHHFFSLTGLNLCE